VIAEGHPLGLYHQAVRESEKQPGSRKNNGSQIRIRRQHQRRLCQGFNIMVLLAFFEGGQGGQHFHWGEGGHLRIQARAPRKSAHENGPRKWS